MVIPRVGALIMHHSIKLFAMSHHSRKYSIPNTDTWTRVYN